MTYKSVTVTRRGGPEVIQILDRELRDPRPGEVRLRVLASPVCQDDIAVRVGNRPFAAKPPFVPGYSILGEVDAAGADVAGLAPGERVVALTQFGGHAETIYLPQEELMRLPAGLDPAETVVLILNYLVAYQILHRVARVKAGDRVLIVGASGGVGSAFLQLGRLAGLKMYGLASPAKYETLTAEGAIPLDYHRGDFVEKIRQVEPDGLDFVFNGMGEEYFEPGLAVLRRRGLLVHYGGPQSSFRLLVLIAKLLFYNLLPNGKKIAGYGTHRLGTELFKEDWAVLFELLGAGRIKPLIAATFPILEAPRAYELLASGRVAGNIVLLAPELLPNRPVDR